MDLVIGVQGRGLGLQPPDSGKAIIFIGQKLTFSGRSQPKMKKIFLYLINKKKRNLYRLAS